MEIEKNVDNKKTNKKNKKNVLTITEIDTVLLPGRHKCECEATTHKLVTNCLDCGRIVCEQENYGLCFTCGNLVTEKTTKYDLELINEQIKLFDQLEKDKSKKNQDKNLNLKSIAASLAGLNDANEHKQKLLDYEQNSEKRTKVIDDELDYFDLTKENWLSNEKREELKEKVENLHKLKFESDRKLEIDFVTREVKEIYVPKIQNIKDEVDELKKETEFKSDYEIVDFKEILKMEPKIKPFYIETKKKENLKRKPTKKIKQDNLEIKKIQNSEIFDYESIFLDKSIRNLWDK